MNRFRIAPEFTAEFEEMWRTRESFLSEVPGFREFHLLRGEADEKSTGYASHTLWESKQAFEDWTESEHFRKAHAKARSPEGMHIKGPKLECFEVIL